MGSCWTRGPCTLRPRQLHLLRGEYYCRGGLFGCWLFAAAIVLRRGAVKGPWFDFLSLVLFSSHVLLCGCNTLGRLLCVLSAVVLLRQLLYFGPAFLDYWC